MLLFGHAGLTLGAAVLLSGALTRGRERKAVEVTATTLPPYRPAILRPLRFVNGKTSSWLTALGSRIDIRLLLFGAILPDLIDKPLGQLFFSDTISNGRIYSHTLLFVIIIALGGLYLYRRSHKVWLLVIAAGGLTHLVLDQMWRTPQTLFWPLQGLSFERIDLSNWVQNLFHALVNEPAISISEPVGAAIIIWFVWQLARRGNLHAFIRKGVV